MVLDGIEHCYKIIHNKQPITTNINETGCIIDVKNVTVPAGKKLTLNATQEINIYPDFDVQTEAELEIISHHKEKNHIFYNKIKI
jgi:hypothetical protein